MQGDSPLDACLVAGVTSTSSKELESFSIDDSKRFPRLPTISMHQFIVLLHSWMVGVFALDANPLAKALCQHPLHGIGEVKGIAPQVEQAHHSFDRPVGV